MARAISARSVSPDQLTLEDWEHVLRARREALEPRGSVKRDETSAPIGVAAKGHQTRSARPEPAVEVSARHRPVATELLETPGALLTRTHLRELGLERRAIDAVFRKLPVIALPGYSRPMIRAEGYLELIDEHTYHDDGVRPLGASAHG